MRFAGRLAWIPDTGLPTMASPSPAYFGRFEDIARLIRSHRHGRHLGGAARPPADRRQSTPIASPCRRAAQSRLVGPECVSTTGCPLACRTPIALRVQVANCTPPTGAAIGAARCVQPCLPFGASTVSSLHRSQSETARDNARATRRSHRRQARATTLTLPFGTTPQRRSERQINQEGVTSCKRR